MVGNAHDVCKDKLDQLGPDPCFPDVAPLCDKMCLFWSCVDENQGID
jgi:hypothetical protein